MPNKTSTDYSGRLVDLFIAQGAKPDEDQKITYGFGTDGGQITTGIQKLAQTWIILFLTERGTLQYHTDLGTDFLASVRFSRIRDTTDVQTQFTQASQLVAAQLNLVADQVVQPDDEVLKTAELTNVALDKKAGKLFMSVTLTSQAGGTESVILPIPLPIQ